MLQPQSQTPISAPADNSGGRSGAGSGSVDPLSRAMLAQRVAQRDQPSSPQPKGSPTSSAHDDPATAVPPVEPPQPGQETLPPESTPQEVPAGIPEGEPGNEPSQDGGETSPGTESNADDLNTALAGLNDDARKHLIEMAKAVSSGATNLGELKRGHKLTQQLEEMRAQLDELRSSQRPPEAAATASPQPLLPKQVAQLKSFEEVQNRYVEAKAETRAIEDYLEENPQGGKIGEREFTRQELINRKRAIQDEIELLPARAHQIQQQGDFTQAQAAARKQTLDVLPWLSDSEHPETKAVKQLIAQIPQIAATESPEYVAAAFLRGDKALKAEIAARKGGRNGAAVTNGVKPIGKVPLGKPHSSNGAAPARVSPEVRLKAATEQYEKDSSRGSFAAKLSASGR